MGHVWRVRRATDERVLEIGLTDQGRELREKAVAIPQQIRDRLSMTEEQLEGLKTVLSQVIDNAKALPRPSDRPTHHRPWRTTAPPDRSATSERHGPRGAPARVLRHRHAPGAAPPRPPAARRAAARRDARGLARVPRHGGAEPRIRARPPHPPGHGDAGGRRPAAGRGHRARRRDPAGLRRRGRARRAALPDRGGGRPGGARARQRAGEVATLLLASRPYRVAGRTRASSSPTCRSPRSPRDRRDPPHDRGARPPRRRRARGRARARDRAPGAAARARGADRAGLRAILPALPASQRLALSTTIAIEFIADDHAARVAGPATVASASASWIPTAASPPSAPIACATPAAGIASRCGCCAPSRARSPCCRWSSCCCRRPERRGHPARSDPCARVSSRRGVVPPAS
ncbi:hypothetical protein BC477_06185 [Clavibacter michiganensis subsp. michiganensis]|uniref:HTH marR-type domain-containing protein n=1 Tax=Clavibacter michiganensis subsp. michiganensis TaxID=33013 RepID=A0A251XLE9_CLAMM|nr:hypothetical protein BC477_06185 [Clavibacter michiganensis subsp. michiganensis]OUE04305.1 hypothetical protein CMMCAS07_05115 [Clavibacter michiganensis subsp. michiganensis]